MQWAFVLYPLGFIILGRRFKYTPRQWVTSTLQTAVIFAGGWAIQFIHPLLRNLVLFSFFGTIARMYWLVGQRTANTRIRDSTDKCSLGVFMGSGGHTAEMKTLLSSLDFARYTPRKYVCCHGDEMSLRVINEIETVQNTAPTPAHTILALPRARQVGESRISTLLSATKTFISTLWHTFLISLIHHPSKPWVDVLLLNGPGTAVVLVAVAWIRRFFGLRSSKIIYVESFARTKSLSLSGKLLRGYVDVFVVQWPEAAGPGSTVGFENQPGLAQDRDNRVIHRGWLV